MRVRLPVTLLTLAAATPMAGQSTCAAGALSSAAAQALHARHTLQSFSVREAEEAISPAVSTGLKTFKDALAKATQAAFSCAAPAIKPEQLQATLADALHANLPSAEDTIVDAHTGLERGAYGAGLTVQVFELFGTPHILEVDFRYGIECGDDNLLLVFTTADSGDPGAWHQELRYGTRDYKTVGDAIGDFILLTPLTGDNSHRNWHYLVAHGHPSCKDTPRASTFDLDLLAPTGDAEKTTVAWHFTHPYTAGTLVPRLATTEATVEFRLSSAPPDASANKAPSAPAAPTAPPEIYRFRLDRNGLPEPVAANGPADEPQLTGATAH